MKRQDWILGGLLAAELLCIGFVSRTVMFPLFAGAVMAVGLSGRYSFAWTATQRTRMLTAAAVVLFVKRLVYPGALPDIIDGPGLAYPDAYAIAQFLVLVQLMLLFRRQDDGTPHRSRPRDTIPFTAATALFLSMHFISSKLQFGVVTALAVLFTLFYALYCAESHAVSSPFSRMRYGVMLLVLLPILGLGAGGALAVASHRANIEQAFGSFLYKFAKGNSVGLSDRATLDSVLMDKGVNAKAVLARIESKAAPGYLRRAGYDTFDGRSWRNNAAEANPLPGVPPPPHPVVTPAGQHCFYLGGGPASETSVLNVFPTSTLAGRVLTPLDTVWAAASVDTLRMDGMRLLRADEGVSGAYSLVAGTPNIEAANDRYRAVPPTLDPRVRVLAQQIFEGRSTPQEKIEAVLAYFASYTYRLGIEVPKGQDPLTYFLIERPPAHCEYFASGATILLRLGGVPCRYVTGLMVTEHNDAGDYWVARNENAHAWAEAWTQEQGWQIVESTPGGFSGNQGQPSRFNQRVDYLKMQIAKAWAEIRSWFAAGGMTAFVESLRRLLSSPWPWGIAVLWVAFTLWRKRRALPPRKQADAALLSYQRLLRRMDRQARRRGLIRPPHETLHQFARRISDTARDPQWEQAAADWYRQYAAARYNRTQGEAMLESLEKELARVSASKNRP